MRTLAIILLSTSFAFGQDCRNVDAVLENAWKRFGVASEKWVAVLDSAIAACPNNPRLWGDKAMGYMIRGEFVEGMAYLEKAVALDPFIYLGNRAWYRMRYLRDYKGALADLDRLEMVAGHSLVYVTNTHMYMLMGICQRELSNNEKALELFDKGINEQIASKGPEWVGLYDYLYRGILKHRMGDHEGAIKDFDQQQKQYELLADTYYYRGLAYAEVGRKDEARQDFQRAKDLLLGEGQKRWEAFVLVVDEVFLTNVETALLRLY